mmetsp:Transcript_18854/g.48359  ORF Transcript_18854/g.48359 Transcript_18854/m.48359 type:complete len:249 (-) Transcript_18854:295-1041(-)
MRICAANAKGAHPCAQCFFAKVPCAEFIVHLEGGSGEVNLRVEHSEVRDRNQLTALQHHQGFDETGSASCTVCMSNVAFHRSEGNLHFVGALLPTDASKRVHEPASLDAVTHTCASAVRLHVGYGPRVIIHHPQCTDHGVALAHWRRCSVACLLAAIVRHSETFHGAPDEPSLDIICAPQDQGRHRVTKDCAISSRVKWADIAIHRADQAILVEVAQIWEGDRGGPSHSSVALASHDGRSALRTSDQS